MNLAAILKAIEAASTAVQVGHALLNLLTSSALASTTGAPTTEGAAAVPVIPGLTADDVHAAVQRGIDAAGHLDATASDILARLLAEAHTNAPGA